MMTIAQEYIQEGMEKGRKEGLEIGRAEGLEQGLERGLMQSILRILEQRFEASTVAIQPQLAEANATQLQSLLDDALTTADFDTFTKQLTAVLASKE